MNEITIQDRIETEGGRTVASSAEVAGSFAADKRAEGYEVTITPRGSDDKRGTKVWFDIEWHRPAARPIR